MKDIFEKIKLLAPGFLAVKSDDDARESCAVEGAWMLHRPRAARQARPAGLRWAPTLALAAVLMTGTAHAAALKTQAVVTGAEITVGDVFDGAGGDAGRYLAPAPALGHSKTLDAHDLQRISDAFGLGWSPASAQDRVTVRRESNSIDRYAIEAALQEALGAQMDGQSFDLDLDDQNLALALPGKAERTVAASEVRIDLQKNSFSAVLSAPAGAEHPTVRKQVSGHLFVLQKLPVLRNPAQPGDVIGINDIDYVDMRSSDVPASIVADADRLIGRTPRRNLAAMKPVGAADITPVTLVKKGDLVTVAMQSGMLGLTLQGRALQDGGMGDTVRVINTGSNRQLEGVVTGAQVVSLRLPATM